MNFEIEELKKILNFILINKKIDILDTSLFTRDNIIDLINIINGKKENDLTLSLEQINYLTNLFISDSFSFDENTPKFIKSNAECIMSAIKNDINSVNYLDEDNYSDSLINDIILLVRKNNYIINSNSPYFLRCNYEISCNSVKLDVSSANYIIFDNMSDFEKKLLVDTIISNGYVLSQNSSKYLRGNSDIVLDSIKKDMSLIKYSLNMIYKDSKIFDYLFLNGYKFDTDELKDKPLKYFLNQDILSAFTTDKISYLSVDPISNDVMKDASNKLSKMLCKTFNNFPKISNFKKIFNYSANEAWEEYKIYHEDYLCNIFGMICSMLKKKSNFELAKENLFCLDKMKEYLGDKYNDLYKAMKEYHYIIHNNMDFELIKASRDTIASLSSLYVSRYKDEYIKNKVDEFMSVLKKCYIPKIDNSLVNKKIVEKIQREKIKELYLSDDMDFSYFINELTNKYSNRINSNVINRMVDGFIRFNDSDLSQLMIMPNVYEDYKRYIEASKLINRLNSNFIKYDDKEISRFFDIIMYDNKNKKYIYVGPYFSQEDIDNCNKYMNMERIFNSIKKDIIFKTKTLKVDNISDKMLKDIANDIPFTDEYFEFDKAFLRRFISLDDLLSVLPNIPLKNIMNDDIFNKLSDYVINNDFIWFLVLSFNYKAHIISDGFAADLISFVIENFDRILYFSKLLNYDINNLCDMLSLCELIQFASEDSIAILSKDVVKKLCKYQEYTSKETDSIIKKAKELVCAAIKRSKSTVPYISGNYGNYNYSMYDNMDESILVCGIDTAACFKVDGNDHDFLHYTVLDKNGFVIKITDNHGNFIGRASGFRNGNSVFINQLRTIYDNGGNKVYCDENTKKSIIEVFKKACEDIVITSQKNTLETDKIQHVFVTKSYILHEYDSNVNSDVVHFIGNYPMDHESEDWYDFLKNTPNIKDIKDVAFDTDYGMYPIICMASVKQPKEIKPCDIISKDVIPVYKRKRNRIIVSKEVNHHIINKINKIKAISCFFTKSDFKMISEIDDSLVLVGDNWFIIYKNGIIINSCLLDFDEDAKREFNCIKKILDSENMKCDNDKSIGKILKLIDGGVYNNDI